MKYCPACDRDVPDDVSVCPAHGTPVEARAEPPDALAGRTVHGRYRIVRKLRQEPIGPIYLAEQVLVRRTVALWVLAERSGQDPTIVTRFRHEARTIGRLDPRYVAMVHDLDETEDGHVFVVMEHPEGRTLAELLGDEGALPVPRALALATQIAEALRIAHAAGVVHGALGPEAIVISRDDMVKLTDLLVSRLRDVGGAERTPAADIQGLGLILDAMLTGEPEPSVGSGSPVRARPAAPVPEILNELVAAMTDADPARRPSSVVEILRQLRAVRATVDDATRLLPQPGAPDPGEPPAVSVAHGPAGVPMEPPLSEPPASVDEDIAGDDRRDVIAARMPRDVVTSPRPVEPRRSSRSGRGRLLAVGGLAAAVILSVAGIFAMTRSSDPNFRDPARDPLVSSLPGSSPTAVPAAPEGQPSAPSAKESEPISVPGADSTSPKDPATQAAPPADPAPAATEPDRIAASAAPSATERDDPVADGTGKPDDAPTAAAPLGPAVTSVPREPVSPPRRGSGPQPVIRPSRAAAEQTRAAVQGRLRKLGLLREAAGPAGLSVDVAPDGVVTLTGILNTREDRERAVASTRATPGVTGVRVRVNVRESWQSGS